MILTQMVLSLRSRAELQVENLALRHQIEIRKRTAPKRARLTKMDRLIFTWLLRLWPTGHESGPFDRSSGRWPGRGGAPMLALRPSWRPGRSPASDLGSWALAAPGPRSGAGDLSTGLPAQRKRCCGATGLKGCASGPCPCRILDPDQGMMRTAEVRDELDPAISLDRSKEWSVFI